MINSRLSFCLFVVVLVVAPVGAQDKKPETITLKKAIEELDLKLASLQGEEAEAQIARILKAESDGNRSAAISAFTDRHQFAQELQISQQRLLLLQRLQGKVTPAKKPLDAWLEQVKTLKPKLPRPPEPEGLLPDFTKIDKHALATPVEKTKNIPQLAQHLIQEAKTDKEKARAIFIWIAENIQYDLDDYLKYKTAVPPEQVLLTRRTICGGYAILFEALAKQAKLQTYKISGFGRGLEDPTRDPRTIKLANGLMWGSHAWNVVMLDGKPYFIDPTYAAGKLLTKGKVEQSKINFDYFLTPADALIYTHSPNDPRLQHLKNTLTKAEQDALPLCLPKFFTYGLKFGSAPQPMLAIRDRLLITLEAPSDTDFHAVLTPLAGAKTTNALPAFVQVRNKVVEIHANVPDAGAYRLSISAGKRNKTLVQKESGERYLWISDNVLEYRIEAQGNKELAPGPTLYGDFYLRGAYLFHPLNGTLAAQKPCAFALSIPQATDAFIKCGEKRTPMKKCDELFIAQVTPEMGEMKVAAYFGDKSMYRYLLKFDAK